MSINMMSCKNPKKILIIRRDNIGDLVCTTPAIRELRKHYPTSEMAVLANSYNASVLRGNPDVDKLFVYEKLKHSEGPVAKLTALVDRLFLIVKLRLWRPDVTILAKGSFDRHGLRFARQIGANNVIGYLPPGGQIRDMPDIGVDNCLRTQGHEVEHVGNLLKPLGINSNMGQLCVYPDSMLVLGLQPKVHANCAKIGLHISAREIERRWGLENFVALTKKLLEQDPKLQVLLFWAPGQANDLKHPGDDDSAKLLIQLVSNQRLVPLATESLDQLIAAISLCDLFVGTDGGALHLAAGLKKPIVALFENIPSKLSHWYPWQVPFRVVYGERPEVSSIDLQPIISAIESLQFEIMEKS